MLKWLRARDILEIKTWLYYKSRIREQKIGILGDSMAKGNGTFDGNCWPERIALRNNMEVDNQAINGKYLTQEIWKDSVIGGQYLELSNDCDIIVICAETNDITAKISIGEDESTDTSTLCGTINTFMPKLREEFSKAKILCITPLFDMKGRMTVLILWYGKNKGIGLIN